MCTIRFFNPTLFLHLSHKFTVNVIGYQLTELTFYLLYRTKIIKQPVQKILFFVSTAIEKPALTKLNRIH